MLSFATCHLYGYVMPPRFCSNLYPQDGEYDSWDVVAEYVFQVTPFLILPPRYSTPSMKELQCYVRTDAPSRSDGDSRGRRRTNIAFQGLIVEQAGSMGNISSLPAKNWPPIVVDASGGQYNPLS